MFEAGDKHKTPLGMSILRDWGREGGVVGKGEGRGMDEKGGRGKGGWRGSKSRGRCEGGVKQAM